ncbi:hypothetical protein [Dyadobacter arcticus]|uniref:Uncharacterized protein n=1 Tax=Dyadobacter arcticus TaxID=1078754 RepID=A0ABX0UPC3_9BACT|nr:hypothetical protein [Dyadobacter arcticus]NIJ52881.1 hypothetical protein [Dyadobacter arcticus]
MIFTYFQLSAHLRDYIKGYWLMHFYFNALSSEIHRVNEELANADNYDLLTSIVEDYLWKKIQKLGFDIRPMDIASRLVLADAA